MPEITKVDTRIRLYLNLKKLITLYLDIETDLEIDLESGDIINRELIYYYLEQFNQLKKEFNEIPEYYSEIKKDYNHTKRLINSIQEKINQLHALV